MCQSGLRKMQKAVLLVTVVALLTNALGGRITRSPGGAGWQGSSGASGYDDSEPSIVAARSGGAGVGSARNAGNFGRSLGGTNSWGGSGLSARSGGYSSSGWGGSGSNLAARSSGPNGITGRSTNGYGGYSGRSAGFAGNSGGYDAHSAGAGTYSSDYSDASGRSVSWQASW